MSIPIVIIHKGAQSHVEKVLQLVRKTNSQVYLLGDDTNIHFQTTCDISHINISSLEVSQAQTDFINSFVNYSTNPHNYELVCFLRVFWLGEFMKKYSITKVFHLDSDCILLYDINSYNFTSDIAYGINSNFDNQYRMAASIHNALLNIEFVEKFIQLCIDIYVNKTKFHLVEDKIKYHKENNILGGICDMTLYYLLIQQGLKVQPLNVANNGYVFINNINGGEGPDSKTQYEKGQFLIKITDNNKIYDTVHNKYLTLFSIHYQGGAKYFLNSHDINSDNYET